MLEQDALTVDAAIELTHREIAARRGGGMDCSGSRRRPHLRHAGAIVGPLSALDWAIANRPRRSR